jgi:hypothetical protein
MNNTMDFKNRSYVNFYVLGEAIRNYKLLMHSQVLDLIPIPLHTNGINTTMQKHLMNLTW